MQSKEPLFSSAPDTPAPRLFCPKCSAALIYRQTVFTFMAPVERWDYLDCQLCGPFEYRHRTRRLRSTVGLDMSWSERARSAARSNQPA